MTTGVAQSNRRWLAYGSLAVCVFGISWTAIFVRWAGVPGTASAFYRVLIAAAVLVPWRTLKAAQPVDRRSALLALVGGVFFACDLALFNAGILRNTASTAVLFANLAPVFVGLASWLIFRQRPNARFWTGLFVALGGCAVIALRDVGRASDGASGDITGDLLALTAAVFWAAYLLTTERARTKLDTLTFSTLAMVGSVVALLVSCLTIGDPLWGYPPRAWLALAGLGLISQLGAYLGLTYALGHLPATIVSIGLLAQIPTTALLAMPLLGEPITATQIVGGFLVLAGVYVVNRK
jgi:drug/metabolite transporter (DMT)-like permease